MFIITYRTWAMRKYWYKQRQHKYMKHKTLTENCTNLNRQRGGMNFYTDYK